MITIQQLKSMTSKQVVALAKTIVRQCRDKESIAYGLGNDDDFFQAVCEYLIEFKMGARELRPGYRLDMAVCGLARGQSRGNWMSDRAPEYDIDTEMDVEDEDETETASIEDEEPVSRSLDNVDGLCALDKLLIQHDAHRSAQTLDIAGFFNITTRAVRMRKEKLHAQLITHFNLPKDIFDEKAEPKLPHLTKKVEEEKDPLANFAPLKLNGFNAYRTFEIR